MIIILLYNVNDCECKIHCTSEHTDIINYFKKESVSLEQKLTFQCLNSALSKILYNIVIHNTCCIITGFREQKIIFIDINIQINI